jgi:hypothetical protein
MKLATRSKTSNIDFSDVLSSDSIPDIKETTKTLKSGILLLIDCNETSSQAITKVYNQNDMIDLLQWSYNTLKDKGHCSGNIEQIAACLKQYTNRGDL